MAGGASMGARRTADLLSKTTSILAALFLSLSVLANFAIDRDDATQSTIQQSGLGGEPIEQFDFSVPSETESAVPQQEEIEIEEEPLILKDLATPRSEERRVGKTLTARGPTRHETNKAEAT